MAVAAVMLALLTPGAARIDLQKTFRGQLRAIHRVASVPVLLPRWLPVRRGRVRVYATGGASTRAWDLELAAAPRCGGADACFVAAFEGRRSRRLPRAANLRLRNGDRAYYHAVGCGGSCAPATLWFVHRRVLYTWQVKEPPGRARDVLARLANEAIAAGPR